MQTEARIVRLLFRKTGRARFLSHLDLTRLFVRAFRRALLPLAYSRGKRPRPRLWLPHPLPVGVVAAGEILEVALERALHPEDVAARLNAHLPPEVRVFRARRRSPAEARKPVALAYTVRGEGLPDARAVARLRRAVSWIVVRRRGEERSLVDVRRHLEELERVEGPGGPELRLVVRVEEGRTVRPDEVLRGLGVEEDALAALTVVRTGVCERVERDRGRPRRVWTRSPDPTAASPPPAAPREGETHP